MSDKNSDFVQFTRKELRGGTETVSRTEYKGYVIRLRSYHGVTVSISKFNDKGGCTELWKRGWYGLLSNCIQKAKDYIDNHENNLIQTFNKKNNHV